MKISRLDLDGVGSPTGLATRIHMRERDLPIPVPIEALCERFDIISIDRLSTQGFEAALVTDECKARGAILVADGQPRKRRRFSIAHELGHFLIPAHLPRAGQILCNSVDMRRSDLKAGDPKRRMEAEANRFASLLLMPPHLIRRGLRRPTRPNLAEVVELADCFDVSKEAMARAYVQTHREAIRILVLSNGRLLRSYPSKEWTWRLVVERQQAVPAGSVAARQHLIDGTLSDNPSCEPDLWLSDSDAAGLDSLSEQLLTQQNGFALLLLHATPAEDADRWAEHRAGWQPGF